MKSITFHNKELFVSEKSKLDLDIVDTIPEEIELMENELPVVEKVTGATSFENVGLFVDERWGRS